MKTASRISLAMVIVGIVGLTLTGGDPDSAVRLGGLGAAAIGALIGLGKEIYQAIRGKE